MRRYIKGEIVKRKGVNTMTRTLKIIILLICGIFIFTLKNYVNAAQNISVVQQGDYIDYSAGTWTQEEINKLKQSNLYSEDYREEFKFNGFKVGTSRDTNAYDPNTPAAWRILYNTGENITIINAGATEGFCSPFYDNCAYYIYFIFTGEKHKEDISDIVKSNTIPRDWSMYENPEYAVQGSARLITLKEAYCITEDDKETSNDLRSIGIKYYTSRLHCDQDMWTVEESGKLDRWGGGNYAIRPVVTLKNNLSVEKTGEYEGHAVWKLVQNREWRKH